MEARGALEAPAAPVARGVQVAGEVREARGVQGAGEVLVAPVAMVACLPDGEPSTTTITIGMVRAVRVAPAAAGDRMAAVVRAVATTFTARAARAVRQVLLARWALPAGPFTTRRPCKRWKLLRCTKRALRSR